MTSDLVALPRRHLLPQAGVSHSHLTCATRRRTREERIETARLPTDGAWCRPTPHSAFTCVAVFWECLSLGFRCTPRIKVAGASNSSERGRDGKIKSERERKLAVP